MKITLFTLLFFIGLHSGQILAQTKTIPNSYEINGVTETSKLEFYKSAVANSNFETYRLKSKRLELKFINGFTLVLFSAKELYIENQLINIENYNEENNLHITKPEFKVTESGAILILYKTKESKY